MIKPPCSRWDIWTGIECEGTAASGLGQLTLFVRRCPPTQFGARVMEKAVELNIRRLWFCREFRNHALMERACLSTWFKSVCVEVTSREVRLPLCALPKAVYAAATLHVRFAGGFLKPTDILQYGSAFNCRSFLMIDGVASSPAQYAEDTKLF